MQKKYFWNTWSERTILNIGDGCIMTETEKMAFLAEKIKALEAITQEITEVFIAEEGSMKRMWNIIDSFKVKRETQNRLFIWSQIMFYALAGAVVWVLLGRLVLPGIDWILCFIGYPAIFIGFFDSVLFLYNNEFA